MCQCSIRGAMGYEKALDLCSTCLPKEDYASELSFPGMHRATASHQQRDDGYSLTHTHSIAPEAAKPTNANFLMSYQLCCCAT